MSKVVEAKRSSTRPSRPVPQRTCVSCRTTTDKRDLVRIVRSPEGLIDPDPSGKAPGRGAYLCAKQACWDSALKTGVLARALRTTIATANAERVAAYGRNTGEGAASHDR